MPSAPAIRRLIAFAALSNLVAVPAQAQRGGAPAGQDYTIHNFRFASGETLPDLRIHYLTLGKPRRDASGLVRNAVMVLHGTTGSGSGFLSQTFGGQLFGPGQLLDTAKYFVVLPDGIGHGRSSKPSDGMHARFPKYTYDDMVDAQHELLAKGLGVNHLRLVMGTSMGCMHAWVWGERYPDFADGLVPLACMPSPIAGRNRMIRTMIMDFITKDPGYNGGDYTTQPAGPATGDGDALHHDVGAQGAAPPGADARQGRLGDPRVPRPEREDARRQRRGLRVRRVARLRSVARTSRRSRRACWRSIRRTTS